MATSTQPILALILVSAGRLAAGPGPVPAFLEACRALGTLRHGNLAVVAVAGAPAAGPALESLDEALGRGKVMIRETGQGGTVNTLLLENHGERAVFILAGEILAGAKQDRILQQDVILPAGGKPVPVAAFCVEHGRWREQSAAFYSEKAAAPLAVRQAAQASKNQSVVWQEVASNNAALAVQASTGSLSETYKRGRVVTVRKAFIDALARLPRAFPSAQGVVVVVNGRVVGADLFQDPRLFAGLWAKLLDSYIAEAARREAEPAATVPETAEAYLARARQARVTLGPAPGLGSQLSLDGPGLKGAGVLLEHLVHLDLFPVSAVPATAPALRREALHQQNVAPSSFRH